MWVYFSPEIPVANNLDFHTGFMFGTGKNNAGDVQAGMGMIGSAKQYPRLLDLLRQSEVRIQDRGRRR